MWRPMYQHTLKFSSSVGDSTRRIDHESLCFSRGASSCVFGLDNAIGTAEVSVAEELSRHGQVE